MKNNDSFSTIKKIIDKSNNILLISHILPDGDNIGSVLGMALSLKSLGKTVTPVVNGVLPSYYEFLAQSSLLVTPIEAQNGNYDLVLALDMSDRQRGGENLEYAFNHGPVINFDHHVSNDYFGDYNYVDNSAAATAQVLTDFLLYCHYPINQDIATAFYVGMLTDSGNFTYDNTSTATLALASELLKYHPDLVQIRINVFENVSFRRKKILGKALVNAIDSPSSRLVYSTLNYEECCEIKAEGQDFEGVIDHLIGISGTEMGLFFREMQKGLVKVGFRGKPGVDVTEVAKIYGGGGHKAAGGCSVEGDFQAVVKDVIDNSVKYMESIK